MNIITNFFDKLFGSSKSVGNDEKILADLMRRESEIGRQLFGPIPNGVRREFFCLDEQTWVWHKESAKGTKITKYLVKDKEVVKSVNGSHYEKVSQEEAEHLRDAALLYQEKVNNNLYNAPK